MSSKSSPSDPLVLPLPHHFPIMAEGMDKVVLPAREEKFIACISKFFSRNMGQPWPLDTHDPETRMSDCVQLRLCRSSWWNSWLIEATGNRCWERGSRLSGNRIGTQCSDTVVQYYSCTVVQYYTSTVVQ